MEEKSIASGKMLHPTFARINIGENLPLMPNKKMLKKWRLFSLFSLTLGEAQTVLQRLESYRQHSNNNEVKWLNEAIVSLKSIISTLSKDTVLNALLQANSVNSLMIIAKELILVRKDHREKIENDVLYSSNLIIY